MEVFELTAQVAFSEKLPQHRVLREIGSYIGSMAESAGQEREMYTFDLPYPREEKKCYEPGKVYSFHIRTVSVKIKDILAQRLPWYSTETVQGLSAEAEVLPRAMLYRVYSVSPVVFLASGGYRRGKDRRKNIITLLEQDLLRKYHMIYPDRIRDKITMLKNVRIENRAPLSVNCGGRILMGDRLDILPETDPVSQDIFYVALGTGLGNYTEYGNGFMGYRVLKEWI